MKRRMLVVVALVASLFAACGGDAAPTTTALPADAAPITIDMVQFRQIGNDPTSVQVDISGTKPSPCHTLYSEINRRGNQIVVQLWATVAEGETCAQVMTGYQATIDLGTYGKGSYHVDLNGRPYDMTI